MKILQDVTDLWTMNITFYKEKLNPLSSLMTGATYWCKKQTARRCKDPKMYLLELYPGPTIPPTRPYRP